MHPAHEKARRKVVRDLLGWWWGLMTPEQRRDLSVYRDIADAGLGSWKEGARATGHDDYAETYGKPSPEVREAVLEQLLDRMTALGLDPLPCETCEGEPVQETPADGRHEFVSTRWTTIECPDCEALPGQRTCQHCGDAPAHLLHEGDGVCVECWLVEVRAEAAPEIGVPAA